MVSTWSLSVYSLNIAKIVIRVDAIVPPEYFRAPDPRVKPVAYGLKLEADQGNTLR